MKSKEKRTLNIRKRLVISNILMILTPIVICVIVGGLGFELMEWVFRHISISPEDIENFYDFSEDPGAPDEIPPKFFTVIRTSFVILFLIMIAAAILSVYFANKFLTRFVFRKIETPLELLETGVEQIKNGNLDYRIEYAENTEFLPVCSAFNEMAVRLKKSVEQTLREEQNRKELLAGISHDIRSPLTSIQAYADGLLDGVADTPERRQKYLTTIKRKSESISNMVSQLFTFSKLDLDDFPVNMVKVDIRTELEKIVNSLADEYLQKGLKICLSAGNAAISLDSALFNRICTNIISNSCKYVHTENPQINIWSEEKESEYILHFEDNGSGVDEKILDRLFDVFYRSDPARKSPDNGSGLGLAIVAKAVKRMNGTVSARNVPNGGLDVIIALSKFDGDDLNEQNSDS